MPIEGFKPEILKDGQEKKKELAKKADAVFSYLDQQGEKFGKDISPELLKQIVDAERLKILENI